MTGDVADVDLKQLLEVKCSFDDETIGIIQIGLSLVVVSWLYLYPDL